MFGVLVISKCVKQVNAKTHRKHQRTQTYRHTQTKNKNTFALHTIIVTLGSLPMAVWHCMQSVKERKVDVTPPAGRANSPPLRLVVAPFAELIPFAAESGVAFVVVVVVMTGTEEAPFVVVFVVVVVVLLLLMLLLFA